MDKYIYDVETFSNFFCVTFVSPDNDFTKQFVIAKDLGIDDWKNLHEFLDRPIELIGFNNIVYDSRILDYVFNNNDKYINDDLMEISSTIISQKTFIGRNFYEDDYNNQWHQVDLMKMMAFDKLGIGLKQIAINLRWHRIQDLPLPYDKPVEKRDIQLILDYNLNDVHISKKLYERLYDQIKLREDLSSLYNVDLSSASDSKIANVLIEKFYKDEGQNIDEIRSLRTRREMIWIKDCMAKGIHFKTEKLQLLKIELDDLFVLSENEFAYNKTIEFANCKYELGIGGLHSDDQPAKFFTTDKWIIRDADVASYYPNIIINNAIKPEHLSERFIDVLKRITFERLKAKKENDKAKADGLKITINSIFGKLGSEYFWLQDPKAMLTVTVSGQLYLLMLIEALTLAGITVISANTDGIVSAIPAGLEEKYNKTCSNWQKETGYELEFTDYLSYIRTDVNNYITKKLDGTTKEKGRYLKEDDLKKGYKYPIVPKSLYEYFVNNISFQDTITKSKDILDFCISQKAGKKFQWVYKTEGKEDEFLQRTNRFFVSKNGGKLLKRNLEKDLEIGLYVGNNVTILNDYDNKLDFNTYQIDYDFYIEEANKYVDDIENSNFDLTLKQEKLAETINKNSSSEEHSINVKIVPACFRYSSDSYIFNKENNTVYRGISNMKYLSSEIGKELYSIKDNTFSDFIDFLIYAEENLSINSRQMQILIKLNFFKEFGNSKKLIKFYEEFTDGKFRYAKKLTDKSKQKRIPSLKEIFLSLPNEDYTIREKISFEYEFIGYVQSTYDVNKKYILVEDLNTDYSPRILGHCLATGKKESMKVKKSEYEEKPFQKFDILYINNFERKPAMTKKGGEWEEVPNKFNWWFSNYKIILDGDIK